MKGLEFFEFFPDTSKFDGLAGDGLHAQCCAAASVAIEFREDTAGNVRSLIEMRGDVDGFLAGGGIEDEQDLLGFCEVAEANEFLDERFVDLETARGVED